MRLINKYIYIFLPAEERYEVLLDLFKLIFLTQSAIHYSDMFYSNCKFLIAVAYQRKRFLLSIPPPFPTFKCVRSNLNATAWESISRRHPNEFFGVACQCDGYVYGVNNWFSVRYRNASWLDSKIILSIVPPNIYFLVVL